MKTIGLLGGMSWESTTTYYQALNRGIASKLGGLHSAKILLHSFDFAEIEALQMSGDWHASGELLADAAARLEQAGADMILIGTNTMHKVAPQVEERVTIPLIHIVDTIAGEAKRQGHSKLGLIGSAFTMEQDFYKSRMQGQYGLEVIVPDEKGRRHVHDIIYNELCRGVITDTSREIYLDVCEALRAAGADAIILGCTEIGLLIDANHTDIPLLDSTQIHADAAVTLAIAG